MRRSTPRVQVVGGSVAGLGMALALERRGVSVEVHEADPAPPLDLAEAARCAPRPSTPQAAHSHAFVARAHALLRSEAPDVLDELHEAGAELIDLAERRPGSIPEHAPHPDEADLVVIAARRTTFELALRRAVARRGIAVHHGRRVAGIRTEADGNRLRVVGVGFEDGSQAGGDLVVDAAGRRSPLAGWLAAQGVHVADRRVECGITYFTRFYRCRPGAVGLALNRGYTHGASFDRYSCLVFPGDADTFSITFGALPEDRALRALRDPTSFDAAVRAIPSIGPWIDAERAEPISGVRMMAGLANRLRRTCDEHGPTVLGFAQIGDAAATTNPAHSRGCTLALEHAAGVADVLARGGEARELAAGVDEVLRAVLEPWVRDSVEQDLHRLARWRPDRAVEPTRATGRISNSEAYVAAQHDAYAWRRFTRLQQLLERPDEVLADPRMVARVRAVQATGRGLPGHDAPDHDGLVDVLAAAR